MAIIFESLLLDLGAILVFLLSFTYFHFKRKYKYWEKLNIPYVKPSFPLGNFSDALLLRTPVAISFTDMYRKLEGHKYGGMFLLQNPSLLIRDPDLIKDVLVKDFSTFHDRGLYTNDEVDPLNSNLFSLSGKTWRNLRLKLTPTFTSGKMKMMFQTLVDCGDELKICLKQKADNTEVIEVKDILARYSTDIISSCAFGIQCNCLRNEDAEFRQWGRKVFDSSLRTILLGFLSGLAPVILDVFKISRTHPKITKYFLDMVKETIEYREKHNIKRNDFMQLMIQLKNNGMVEEEQDGDENNKGAPEKIELSLNTLAAQAFVFFVGGFETSSTTMTFCLYELSVNPDIQERLREEIDNVLEKHDGKFTYEAIMQMNYLDMVVSETLRKYPPLALLNRQCLKPYTIPGTDIILEEGTKIVIATHGLHHDPMYYPHPERFDPERFNEEEKAKRHNYVYLPFGEGPRNCIGMRFGLLQTKVGLASLMSKYRFSVSDITPIPLELDVKSFIMSPRGGMWLQISNR